MSVYTLEVRDPYGSGSMFLIQMTATTLIIRITGDGKVRVTDASGTDHLTILNASRKEDLFYYDDTGWIFRS